MNKKQISEKIQEARKMLDEIIRGTQDRDKIWSFVAAADVKLAIAEERMEDEK